MLLVHAIFVMAITMLLPSIAEAWGPGMHVEVAMSALTKMAIMAPVIRGIVQRFPDAFIYGATSPDIIVGKKYAGYFHHCHNWRMGTLILNEAKTPSQKAAAYGYLTHLAADIVAHNYYIPVKIIRSFTTRLLSHTYWEMRFDLGVPNSAWDRLRVVRKLEIEEFDRLLERVLRKTLFSFSTNKRIFNTIVILQKMRSLRSSLKIYAKLSRFDIGEENRKHYVDLTMEAALGFLSDPKQAPCLQVDPAGLAKLAYAKKLRKNIRTAISRRLIDESEALKFVELVKERLAIGLYRPEMTLPEVVDIL